MQLFLLFQAAFVDFKLVMVKRCAWGTCDSDTRYSERLEGDLRFFLKSLQGLAKGELHFKGMTRNRKVTSSGKF